MDNTRADDRRARLSREPAVKAGLLLGFAILFALSPSPGHGPGAAPTESSPVLTGETLLRGAPVPVGSPSREDRAKLCEEAARQQRLKGDDYRHYMIRCINNG